MNTSAESVDRICSNVRFTRLAARSRSSIQAMFRFSYTSCRASLLAISSLKSSTTKAWSFLKVVSGLAM